MYVNDQEVTEPFPGFDDDATWSYIVGGVYEYEPDHFICGVQEAVDENEALLFWLPKWCRAIAPEF
jgi:hypothetical protein